MSKEPAPTDNALWRIQDWFPELSANELSQLHGYFAELLKFNPKINLISRNTERDADEAHVGDCVLAARLMAKANVVGTVHDLGSGNGLPGLVFAILMPTLKFNLIESDSRKAEFMKHVAFTLKLPNVTVTNARIESLPNESIQTAVTRGFATVTKACLAANKLFATGGAFYHLKGTNWSTEVVEIPSQLMSVWAPELVGEYTLPVSQARRAIVRTRKK